MELPGVSLLASREQPASPSLRAIGEEDELSIHAADQGRREQNADARSDFAGIFTFLFPSPSPEEQGRNEEQRGSTAFGQANHVDTLFPQSRKETFPSSPESVPTHGVSSALSSPGLIIPTQRDETAPQSITQQDADFVLHDQLPVGSCIQTELPLDTPDGGTVLVALEGRTALKTRTSHMLSRQSPREEEGDNGRQAIILNEMTVVSQAQTEDSPPALTIAPDGPTVLQPEPERDDLLAASSAQSVQAAPSSSSLLPMVAALDMASTPPSEQRGLRSSVLLSSRTSPPVQAVHGQTPDHLLDLATPVPATQSKPVDVSSTGIASESDIRVTCARDLTLAEDSQESLVIFPHASDTAALNDTTSLLSSSREVAGQEVSPPGASHLPDQSPIARAAEKQFAPSLSPPLTANTSQGPGTEGRARLPIRDTAYSPTGSQHETPSVNSQPWTSSTVPTSQTLSLEGQRFRAPVKSDMESKVSESDPTPILSLRSDGESLAYPLAPQTSAVGKEDSVERRLRVPAVHMDSSWEGDGLLAPGPNPTMSHFLPSVTRNSTTAGPMIIEQVAGEIATHISRDSKKAVLELEPHELGKVQIDLVLDGEKVQVRIVTETAEVGTLVQTHLPELKTALQHHNLELGTVSVDVNAREGERGASADTTPQHFGAHGRESGREPARPPHETEQVEPRRSGSTQLQHSGVSVWA